MIVANQLTATSEIPLEREPLVQSEQTSKETNTFKKSPEFRYDRGNELLDAVAVIINNSKNNNNNYNNNEKTG